MKGIVFNLLEDAVREQYGADTWADLVDMSGVGGVYTSLGSYPDEEALALADAAAAALGTDREAILRWFGRKAMPKLAERFSDFFTAHGSARSFVRSVNEIIHPEVRKLYSGAGCPHFEFTDAADGALVIGYQSPRRMCHLALGFIEGASDHYGETVALEHLACMTQGAPVCRISARWAA